MYFQSWMRRKQFLLIYQQNVDNNVFDEEKHQFNQEFSSNWIKWIFFLVGKIGKRHCIENKNSWFVVLQKNSHFLIYNLFIDYNFGIGNWFEDVHFWFIGFDIVLLINKTEQFWKSPMIKKQNQRIVWIEMWRNKKFDLFFLWIKIVECGFLNH